MEHYLYCEEDETFNAVCLATEKGQWPSLAEEMRIVSNICLRHVQSALECIAGRSLILPEPGR